MNYGFQDATFAGRADAYPTAAERLAAAQIGRPFGPPPEASAAFALHERIMKAPLSPEEQKIAEQAKSGMLAAQPFIGAAVTAGLTTLLGVIVGSEHYGRNAAIGAVLGFGVGVVAQVATVANVSSQIARGRQAKYAAEVQHLMPHAGL